MPPLVTVSDIEARLGRTLTTPEQARINALLADTSAYIRGYTKQNFTSATSTSILVFDRGYVKLPHTPVTGVTSVKFYNNNTVGAEIHGYDWDGADRIYFTGVNYIVNLPEEWYSISPTVQVVYTHGYSTVPEDIQAVAAAMVVRNLSDPNPGNSGILREIIGEYSYWRDTPSTGPNVFMSDADKGILDRYRRTVGTTKLRY